MSAPLRLVVVVLAAALQLVPGVSATECAGGTLSLSGTGSASAPSDESAVTFTIKTFHATSMARARAACAERATQTIASVRQLGVPARNVTTQSVHMSPEYDYNNRNSNSANGKHRGGPVLVGYSVSNSVKVTIGELAKLADVIDAATTAAGTDLASLSGPSFHLSAARQTELQKLARVRAVADVAERAQDVAEAAGCRVGKVEYLSDRPPAGVGSTGGGGFSAHSMMKRSSAAMESADFATPVMAGSGQSVSVTWYAVYELA